jgi:hypothetical protein
MDPLAGRRSSVALLESLIVFTVSLLIGAFGIYVGARVFTMVDSYGRALTTALVGALVWAVVGFFVGWLPLLGPLVVFLAWLAVVNLQYPGGWPRAAGIAMVAWLTAGAVLYGLALLNVVAFEAVGVPAV